MRTRLAIITLLAASTACAGYCGTLFRQEVEGSTRVCYYRNGTEVTVKTVPVSEPCPVNCKSRR